MYRNDRFKRSLLGGILEVVVKYLKIFILLIVSLANGEMLEYSCQDSFCFIKFDEEINTLYKDSACSFVDFIGVDSMNVLKIKLNYYGNGPCKILLNKESKNGLFFYSIRKGIGNNFFIYSLEKKKYWNSENYYGLNGEHLYYTNLFSTSLLADSILYYTYSSYEWNSGEKNYVKKWDENDIKIKCDFVENHPAEDSNYTGYLNVIDLPCFIERESSYPDPEILKDGKIETVSIYRTMRWNEKDSIKIYDKSIMTDFPIFLRECIDSICYADVLYRISYIWGGSLSREKSTCYDDLSEAGTSYKSNELDVESNCKFTRFETDDFYSLKIIVKKSETCSLNIKAHDGNSYQAEIKFVLKDNKANTLYTKKPLIAKIKEPIKKVVCFSKVEKKELGLFSKMKSYVNKLYEFFIELFEDVFFWELDLGDRWSNQYIKKSYEQERDSVYIIQRNEKKDTVFVK